MKKTRPATGYLGLPALAGRLCPLCFIILLALTAAACIKHSPRNGAALELTANESEANPSGLAIEVLDFNWNYYNHKGMIKITGTVRNNTGQAHHAITLHAMATDETGRGVMSGRSFLDPTYLPDGGEAKFEFIGLTPKNLTDIKYIRLVTTATVLR